MNRLCKLGTIVVSMAVILTIVRISQAYDIQSPEARLAPKYSYTPYFQNPGAPDILLLEAPDSNSRTPPFRISLTNNLVVFQRSDTRDAETTALGTVRALRYTRTDTVGTNINVIPFDFYLDNPPSYLAECVVDFNDQGALTLTEPSLWFDRIYLPWFQACDGSGYVDMRPLVEAHFHLGFEDPEVLPCFSDAQAFPSIIDDDGTCHFVDIPTEPRTHITTHTPSEYMWLRFYGNNDKWLTFALNQIRVVGSNPVRICYRKDQEIDLSWLTSGEQSGTVPGVWLCWSEISPGAWDLSHWVWDVTDVKITGADNATGPFSLDDLKVAAQ
jgi:hypothetical protein